MDGLGPFDRWKTKTETLPGAGTVATWLASIVAHMVMGYGIQAELSSRNRLVLVPSLEQQYGSNLTLLCPLFSLLESFQMQGVGAKFPQSIPEKSWVLLCKVV